MLIPKITYTSKIIITTIIIILIKKLVKWDRAEKQNNTDQNIVNKATVSPCGEKLGHGTGPKI